MTAAPAKVMIAQFQQESNSFSPLTSGLELFRSGVYAEGERIVGLYRGTRTEISGFLTALGEAGADVVPVVAAHAVSSGPLRQETFDAVLGAMAQAWERHGPADGILLCMHGAMLLEPDRDATGLFLERLRELAGERAAIVATLDLHANATARMAAAADALVGYHTYPHVDLFETGAKAAKLLLRIVRGEVRPAAALVKLPMIVSGEKAQTTGEPMRSLIALLGQAEAEPGVLAASLFQMQPWLDVADAGCAVYAVADGDESLAGRVAARVAQPFWDARERLLAELTPLSEAVEAALAAPSGPVVLADSADGTGSGSPGDSTAILRELLRCGTERRCYLTVVDPETVARATEVGVGNLAEFAIGGKIDTRHHAPVCATARVKLLGDGEFTFKGPQFTGATHHMGRTAVLAIGGIRVVAMEKPAFNWDPELYRSVGLEPRDAQVVVVKSPTAFRANYEAMASAIYVVDAPGASSANLQRMPFARLPRPLFPFDADCPFEPQPALFAGRERRERQ